MPSTVTFFFQTPLRANRKTEKNGTEKHTAVSISVFGRFSVDDIKKIFCFSCQNALMRSVENKPKMLNISSFSSRRKRVLV